jgi:hypothetical protein
MQIGVRQAGLPVMRMHNVRYKARDSSQADIGSNSPECSETNAIIGPLLAVWRRIGISRTCVKRATSTNGLRARTACPRSSLALPLLHVEMGGKRVPKQTSAEVTNGKIVSI